MGCSVCLGINERDCPVCGSHDVMTCPECNGEGSVHMALDIRTYRSYVVTETAYTLLPDDEDAARALHQNYCKDDIVTCSRCDGLGTISKEEGRYDYE